MNKKILFISAARETRTVYHFLQELKNQGNEIHLLSDFDTGPPPGLFEKEYLFDVTRVLPAFNFVKDLNIHFDGVITRSVDPVTPLIAMLTRHFGGIGNDPKAAFHSRSKYHMRKIMRAAGVPGPGFALCKNFEDLRKAVAEIGIPCVAKPVGWHSSFGTFMLRNEGDLLNLESNYRASIDFILSQASANCSFAREELEFIGVDAEVDMMTDYMVEEFLDGPEITVDAIVQDGRVSILGMEEQLIMDPPYFVRLGGIMPFECSPAVEEEIVHLLEKITGALGIMNSPTHTELIFTSQGPRLVEIACRGGSDNLHDSIYHMNGHSMVYESAMVALGIPRKYDTKPRNHVATEYLLPSKKGVLSSITVPPEIEAHPDLVIMRITAEAGSIVSPPPENFDYLGYISVKGNTRDEARHQLREFVSSIKVDIR